MLYYSSGFQREWLACHPYTASLLCYSLHCMCTCFITTAQIPHTHNTHTYTHTHTRTHTHTHTCTHTHTHTLHRGRVVHYIAAHIEEISENGADVAHLTALHQPGVTGGGGLDFAETWLSKLIKHNWTATWKSKTESLRYLV